MPLAIASENAVEDAVPPLAAAEANVSQYSLTCEAGAFECSALRDVLDFGVCLDSIMQGLVEQVADDELVRTGSDALISHRPC